MARNGYQRAEVELGEGNQLSEASANGQQVHISSVLSGYYENQRFWEKLKESKVFRACFIGLLVCLGFGAIFALIAAIWRYSSAGKPAIISKIAFGSCSAYDNTPQTIWTDAVIPSSPDAWIWVGDMAYMDVLPVDCGVVGVDFPGCNCTLDFLHSSLHSCKAGDYDNARLKMETQLQESHYARFLEYMCPGYQEAGLFPAPPGWNRSVCPRPVLGVYDDHDYAWNNGNRRLPMKGELKQLFLDAIGESSDSVRRNQFRGIETAYTLNSEDPDRAIDVILLDTRFDRSPLPCQTRRESCEAILAGGPEASSQFAWCKDFLVTGGITGENGSCCKADEEIFMGWCTKTENRQESPWQSVCNVSAPDFGLVNYNLRQDGTLQVADPRVAGDWEEKSPFCEMMGAQQRSWLESTLSHSKAPVRIVATGSVLFGSSVLGVNALPRFDQFCSGDDWDCYHVAQRNFLATLARHQRKDTCTVVITGDYHFHDLKVVQAGEHPYTGSYGSSKLLQPLYQVMSSGMANSTSTPGSTCSDFRLDKGGARYFGECSFISYPGFGMIDIDWESRIMRLQVRLGINGHIEQQLSVDLASCQTIEHPAATFDHQSYPAARP